MRTTTYRSLRTWVEQDEPSLRTRKSENRHSTLEVKGGTATRKDANCHVQKEYYFFAQANCNNFVAFIRFNSRVPTHTESSQNCVSNGYTILDNATKISTIRWTHCELWKKSRGRLHFLEA